MTDPRELIASLRYGHDPVACAGNCRDLLVADALEKALDEAESAEVRVKVARASERHWAEEVDAAKAECKRLREALALLVDAGACLCAFEGAMRERTRRPIARAEAERYMADSIRLHDALRDAVTKAALGKDGGT